MGMRRWQMAAAGFALCCGPVHAEVTLDFQEASDAYVAILDQVRHHQATMEELFGRVTELRNVGTSSQSGQLAAIEKLTPGELEASEHRLKGLVLNNTEFLAIEIDPEFFFALSKRYGRKVDQAFFLSYRKTMDPSDPFVPVYLEQVTDYSACDKYGGGQLSDALARWTAFQKRWPGHYQTYVSRKFDDLGRKLANTDEACVCGDQEDLVQELHYFLKTYPGSPQKAAVRRRLELIDAGQATDRLQCRPS